MGKIIIINERQHLKNDYVCDFCGNDYGPVIGRCYGQTKQSYPDKFYMFSYCKHCAKILAQKLLNL